MMWGRFLKCFFFHVFIINFSFYSVLFTWLLAASCSLDLCFKIYLKYISARSSEAQTRHVREAAFLFFFFNLLTANWIWCFLVLVLEETLYNPSLFALARHEFPNSIKFSFSCLFSSRISHCLLHQSKGSIQC